MLVHFETEEIRLTAGTFWSIVRVERDFPLGIPTRKHICTVHSHETARIIVEMANTQRMAGIIEGMERFAWWADGQQMVGTCGTTLKHAIEDVRKEFGH